MISVLRWLDPARAPRIVVTPGEIDIAMIYDSFSITVLTLLEDLGYMARAAYLMDRMMSGVGLSGRSFIPLLSSFACAVPGIISLFHDCVLL